jgi:hypothetical protein
MRRIFIWAGGRIAIPLILGVRMLFLAPARLSRWRNLRPPAPRV